MEALVKSLVPILAESQRAIPLLKIMIYQEFASVSSEEHGSILRGNSFVNQLATSYVRLVGINFLRQTLGGIIHEIVADEQMELEIDPK